MNERDVGATELQVVISIGSRKNECCVYREWCHIDSALASERINIGNVRPSLVMNYFHLPFIYCFSALL